jgi:hypothetical protein
MVYLLFSSSGLWPGGAAEGAAENPGPEAPVARAGTTLAGELAFPLGTPPDGAMGAGGQMVRYWLPAWLPWLSTDFEMSYHLLPREPGTLANPAAGSRIDVARLGVGLSGRIPIGKRFRLDAGGTLGAAAAMADWQFPPGFGWYWSAESGFSVLFGNSFGLRLQARYVDQDALARTLCVGVGFDLSGPAPPRRTGQSCPAAGGSTASAQTVTDARLAGGSRPPPPSDTSPLALLAQPPIPELSAKVRRDPAHELPRLVAALVNGAADDFVRARAIHDWVATNIAYDAEAFYGRSPMVTEPSEVLRRGASVCQGYAEVFQSMCRIAGIECVLISGYARGVGFDAQQEASAGYENNHAWNAVRIQGLWYLLDCTWDSGYLDPRAQKSVAEYATSYLFSDPRAFLHTHFPAEARWQLLDTPLSFREFCALPYLRGNFFQQGLVLQSGIALVNKVEDRLELTVRVPPEASLLVHATGDDGKEVDAFQQPEGEEHRIRVAFPAPGAYRIALFVGRQEPGKLGGSYLGAGELAILASRGTNLIFPQSSGALPFSGIEVLFPLPYDPQVEAEVRLPFRVPPGILLSALLLRPGWTVVAGRATVIDEGGKTVVRATFPEPGEYILSVNANREVNPLPAWGLVGSFRFQALQGTAR